QHGCRAERRNPLIPLARRQAAFRHVGLLPRLLTRRGNQGGSALILRALVFLVLLASPALADDDRYHQCYTSQENPGWTIVKDQISVGELLWHKGGKVVELTTTSTGTGIARSATEQDGTVHTYLYVGETLVFDMVPYEPGCPSDLFFGRSPSDD